MKILLGNAFSLNMVNTENMVNIRVMKLENYEVRPMIAGFGGIDSCVGHEDTAAVFSQILGIDVPVNRATISLFRGDQMIVGQYIGPRLPEGAKTLPQGAEVNWLLVSILK